MAVSHSHVFFTVTKYIIFQVIGTLINNAFLLTWVPRLKYFPVQKLKSWASDKNKFSSKTNQSD